MAGLLSQDEIDVLMGAISTGDAAAAPSRTAAARTPKTVHPYDFLHPMAFSREQIKHLQASHNTFARILADSLSAYFRMGAQAKCIGVDQLPYKEFIASLPNACPAMKLVPSSGEGSVLMVVHSSIGSGALDPLPGGVGAPDVLNRPFTEIELTMLDDVFTKTANALIAAWSGTGPQIFRLASIEPSPDLIQIALSSETIGVVTIEVSFAQTQGMICICYPASVVGTLRGASTSNGAAEKKKPDTITRIRRNTEQVICKIPLRMTAKLGSAKLTVSELLQIKPGDVVPLDRSVHDPVDVEIGGKIRFKGFLGAFRGKKAVLVDQRIDKPEQE